MASVRSKGNRSTEGVMVALLRRARIRGWRRHLQLTGRPDFAWPRLRVALFVDGCFWHGCSRCYRPPKSNVDFWQSKVAMNQRRDRKVARQLRALGWSVIRVRECALKTESGSGMVVARLNRKLESRQRQHHDS